MKAIKTDIKNLGSAVEDRSRRNNISIEGIVETPNEAWEECEMKVQEMLRMIIGIEENIEINRCHRIILKKKDPTRPPTHPRTISCRLTLSRIIL